MLRVFLFLFLFHSLSLHAQGPFIGKCKSGDCKDGKGVYQIAVYATLEGSFKNGKPDGTCKITNPAGWYITGAFAGDVVSSYKEYTLPKNELNRTGKAKVITYEREYVNGNWTTQNFYELNGTFFKLIMFDTCTFYLSADMSVTGRFDVAKPNVIQGKGIVRYQEKNYNFDFGTSVWVLGMNRNSIINNLAGKNYATNVMYDYNTPANSVVVSNNPVQVSPTASKVDDNTVEISVVSDNEKKFYKLLLQLESHIAWEAVTDDWKTKRDNWVRLCNNPVEGMFGRHALNRLAELEGNTKSSVMEPAFISTRQSSWRKECDELQFDDKVASLLLEYERNLKWTAVDKDWSTKREAWIAEAKTIKEVQDSNWNGEEEFMKFNNK